MSIVCAICGKKQSGWIEDYALSSEIITERICVECNEHLVSLRGTQDKEVFQQDKKYLYTKMNSQSVNVKNYINNLLQYENEIDSSMNLLTVLAQNKEKRELNEKNEFERKKASIILTTSSNVEGYSIIKYCGIVSADKVNGIGVKASFRAMRENIAPTLTGEEVKAYSDRIDELKQNVLEALKEKAIKLDANCIIGLDLESVITDRELILVSGNGTAVITKKHE